MTNTTPLKIDADFPGGNIEVEAVDGDRLRVRQQRRDTERWWFYWAFRVRGAAGRTLRVEFTDGNPVGVRGPAVSLDGGATWAWLGAEAVDGAAFRCAVPAGAAEVRFAVGIPYLQAEWEGFLRRYAGHPALHSGTLCTSRHGRPVECLTLRPAAGEPAYRVCLTSRHHCCEAMATWALQGVLEAVLDAANSAARWLADRVEWLAVPFVDKDGSEEGDQGKGRLPRDHGRDYLGDSLYPETAALRARLPAWGAGPHVVFDLHCPWIRGGNNEEIFLVGARDEAVWRRQQRFGALLEAACRGPLPYRAADNLPFGPGSWNNEANSAGGQSLCRWASLELDPLLVTSLELPYANARGVPVTPAAARAFGADLAAALCAYLQEVGSPERG